jgi:hypothetical protein
MFQFDFSYNSFVPRSDEEYASQDTVWRDIGVGVLTNAYAGAVSLSLPGISSSLTCCFPQPVMPRLALVTCLLVQCAQRDGCHARAQPLMTCLLTACTPSLSALHHDQATTAPCSRTVRRALERVTR